MKYNTDVSEISHLIGDNFNRFLKSWRQCMFCRLELQWSIKRKYKYIVLVSQLILPLGYNSIQIEDCNKFTKNNHERSNLSAHA